MSAVQDEKQSLWSSDSLSSFALLFALFALIAQRVTWWHYTNPPILGAARYSLLLSLLFLALAIGVGIARPAPGPLYMRLAPRSPYGAALVLFVLFISDWLTRPYNFFQGPSIRGEILLCAAAAFWMIRSRRISLISWVAVAAIVWAFLSFFSYTGGRLIFSDDHTTFMYRLMQLKENFPWIPFFEPRWNGGIDARDFFATGALNFFLILAPLVYGFDIPAIYNVLVALILFAVLPGSTYAAARLQLLPRRTAFIAAALSLSVSLMWYRWGLKYGTMGFVTMAALLPLSLSLVTRVLLADSVLRRREIAYTVVILTLTLLWPPAAFAFVPTALLGFFRMPRLLKKRPVRTILLLLLCINLPWMYAFWNVSNVGSFVSAPSHDQLTQASSHSDRDPGETERLIDSGASVNVRRAGFSFPRSLRLLRESAISMNPLLLCFAIPGIFLLPRGNRSALALTYLWLILLGSLAAPLRPHMELDRFLLVVGMLSTVPAAAALSALFATARTIPEMTLAGLAGGFLLCGPWQSAAIIGNRSIEQYHLAAPAVQHFAEAINRYGGSGRVLFSGFVLHQLSGGHLAPLVYLTSKPLMASSHVHNLWSYRQVFPDYFIARKPEGIDEYLDLLNVSAVVTHEKEWREFFAGRPEQFEQSWNDETFTIFRRRTPVSGYFLSGAGQVLRQNSNSIAVRIDTAEAVLKFNYFPFLTSSKCILDPAPVQGDLNFIKLRNCAPGEEILITSKNILARLFGKR